MPLNKDGSLCRSVEGPGKTLNPKQVKRLLHALNDPASYQSSFAKCFTPHHALVLYDAKDKAVGQVAICFECDQLVVEVTRFDRRSLSGQGMKSLIKLCREKGLDYSHLGKDLTEYIALLNGSD